MATKVAEGSAAAETLSAGLAERARRLQSRGDFGSVDEVPDEALGLLDVEVDAWEATVRAKLKEALDDQRPAQPLKDAFVAIRRDAREDDRE